MNNDIDNILKESLKPIYDPDQTLNEKILSGKIEKPKASKRALTSLLPKIAAAAIVLIVAGAGAYAAFNKVYVDEHSISTGKPFNMTEDEYQDHLQAMNDPSGISTDIETTTESFNNIKEPLQRFRSQIEFSKPYTLLGDVCLNTLKSPDGLEKIMLSAFYLYNDGYFTLQIDQINNDSILVSSGMILDKTMNVRDYTAKSGICYTLVDSKLDTFDENGNVIETIDRTIVKFPFKSPDGYIEFNNLSDHEIHEVLDSITIINPEEE